MPIIAQHFWVAFIVVTVVNGVNAQAQLRRSVEVDASLAAGYARLFRGYYFWANVPWLVMGVGILTGNATSVFDFLQPGQGNPFVIGWYCTLAGLLALGTFWMFVGDGAKSLELHPGLPMLPRWPAKKLKLFWLGAVAWNVVIGGLLFSGFPYPGSRPGLLFDAVFPIFFVAMWVGMSFLLSAMGGWSALAKHYPASEKVQGKMFRMRSAKVGQVGYGSCITLGVCASGLYVSVLFPFRLGHPPLLIPWNDVSSEEITRFFFMRTSLHFAQEPSVTVQVSRALGDEILRGKPTGSSHAG